MSKVGARKIISSPFYGKAPRWAIIFTAFPPILIFYSCFTVRTFISAGRFKPRRAPPANWDSIDQRRQDHNAPTAATRKANMVWGWFPRPVVLPGFRLAGGRRHDQTGWRKRWFRLSRIRRRCRPSAFGKTFAGNTTCFNRIFSLTRPSFLHLFALGKVAMVFEWQRDELLALISRYSDRSGFFWHPQRRCHQASRL